MRMDETWAVDDEEIKRIVPWCNSDPSILPEEPFRRIRSIRNVTTLVAVWICSYFAYTCNNVLLSISLVLFI